MEMLSRMWGGRQCGLAAGLDRINRLLSPTVGGYAQPKRLGRLPVITRLLRLALGNPLMILRLMHPRRIKKAMMFLAKNEWNLQHLLMRAERFHFQQNQEPQRLLSEYVFPLISRYGLPRFSEDESPALPGDDEVRDWVRDLTQLASRLREKSVLPKVSIIIPVYNQIRFTLACLHSIFAHVGRQDYEIIISDDHSIDQTPDVFKTDFPRVRYLRNEDNLGFVRNCNKAAETARGRYILFLNNDTVVLPDWLDALVKTLDEDPSVGLVGSKLIFPEGLLQEAGGIVFEDGSGWNYGRLSNPWAPQFNYMPRLLRERPALVRTKKRKNHIKSHQKWKGTSFRTSGPFLMSDVAPPKS